MNTDFSHARIVSDLSGLADVKLAAKNQSGDALEEVALQFESLFLQMMLKNMRDASLGDSMFDSNQMQFYQDMYDKQLAMHLAERKSAGIAELLIRQLGQDGGENSDLEMKAVPEVNHNLPAFNLIDTGNKKSLPETNADTRVMNEFRINPSFSSPEDFLSELKPLADKYAKELGVESNVLLAQAALETGWGKKIIQSKEGVSSHNLFGIKADSGWQGESRRVPTLEYRQEQFHQVHADFRSYDSFEQSFKDYVSFIKNNSRYEDALNQAGDSGAYVKALQTAGYATDPHYADKIIKIMQSYDI